VRDADIIILYGGDEFLIVFPEMDRGLEEVEERIREALDAWNRERGDEPLDFPLTLAMGVALWDPRNQESNVVEALREADRRRHEDKNGLPSTLRW